MTYMTDSKQLFNRSVREANQVFFVCLFVVFFQWRRQMHVEAEFEFIDWMLFIETLLCETAH